MFPTQLVGLFRGHRAGDGDADEQDDAMVVRLVSPFVRLSLIRWSTRTISLLYSSFHGSAF